MSNYDNDKFLLELNDDDKKYAEEVLNEVNKEDAIENLKFWILNNKEFLAPTGKKII